MPIDRLAEIIGRIVDVDQSLFESVGCSIPADPRSNRMLRIAYRAFYDYRSPTIGQRIRAPPIGPTGGLSEEAVR